MELKKTKGGLGKGLGSFGLSGSFKDGHKSGYELDITKIRPNPNQPRKRFTEEDMETLVASIQAHGLIAPIAVRKVDDYYEIVAGERRWRACQQAGLTKIPVVVRDYCLSRKLATAKSKSYRRSFWISVLNGYFQKNTGRNRYDRRS